MSLRVAGTYSVQASSIQYHLCFGYPSHRYLSLHLLFSDVASVRDSARSSNIHFFFLRRTLATRSNFHENKRRRVLCLQQRTATYRKFDPVDVAGSSVTSCRHFVLGALPALRGAYAAFAPGPLGPRCDRHGLHCFILILGGEEVCPSMRAPPARACNGPFVPLQIPNFRGFEIVCALQPDSTFYRLKLVVG